MHPVSIREVCRITGAAIRGAVSPSGIVDRAVIDSRHAGSGCLFFALPGTRTHGIRFAETARRRGAVVVAASEAAAQETGPVLVVDCPVQALQKLARANRLRSDSRVIGITGSVGKTTTRHMLSTVLSVSHGVIQSPASYNNELGVPLSVLLMDAQSEFAAVELGAGRTGDIAALCRIAVPEFGIVTRVAPAHLETFRSVQAVAATKAELVVSLPRHGTVFLNSDDPAVAAMRSVSRCRTVTFGTSRDADVCCRIRSAHDRGLTVQCSGVSWRIPVCGPHHLTSVAAVLATAQEIGMSTGAVQEGLDRFQPLPGRHRLRQTACGIRVIDDTYNANPASVQAAIESLSRWPTSGQRIAVLGDMLELGPQAGIFHRTVGRQLAAERIDHTAVFGSFAADVAAGYLSAGGPIDRISVCDSFPVLLNVLSCVATPGDVVLVKGSRGMAMERVVQALCDDPDTAEQQAA